MIHGAVWRKNWMLKSVINGIRNSKELRGCKSKCKPIMKCGPILNIFISSVQSVGGIDAVLRMSYV